MESSGFPAPNFESLMMGQAIALVMRKATDLRELNTLTFKVNGLAMRVHRELGMGCLEVLYKDALELELKLAGLKYEREKKYEVNYRGVVLKHKFQADFIVENCLVIEAKAQNGIAYENYKQTINYLAITKCPIALIYNFGEPSLEIKRVILTHLDHNA